MSGDNSNWMTRVTYYRCTNPGEEVPQFVQATRPLIVCLCGSTRFKEAFEKAYKDETLAGNIVLSVGIFGHQEGLNMDGPVKVGFDLLHLKKIDLADEVLILNVGGYIGKSTRSQLEYAKRKHKTIRFLEPEPRRDEQ